MTNKTLTIQFNDTKLCGLGEQLVSILQCLEETLKDKKWYVGDIEGIKHDKIEVIEKKMFPDTRTLIEYAESIHQFLLGVFVAVPNSIVKEEDLPDLDTELPLQGIQVEDGTLEIRADDTTYFVIYTDLEGIKEKLQEGLAEKIRFIEF